MSRTFNPGDRVRIKSVPGINPETHGLTGKYRIVKHVEGNIIGITNTSYVFGAEDLTFVRSADAAKAANAKQRTKTTDGAIVKGSRVKCINGYGNFVSTGNLYTVESVQRGNGEPLVKLKGVDGQHYLSRFVKVGK